MNDPIAETRERVIIARGDYTVQIDRNVFGTAVSRKVYCTDEAAALVLPVSHRHSMDHTFCLIRGRAVLRMVDEDGEFRTCHLELTRVYMIKGTLFHQLKLFPHTIIESDFPTVAWTHDRVENGQCLFERGEFE